MLFRQPTRDQFLFSNIKTTLYCSLSPFSWGFMCIQESCLHKLAVSNCIIMHVHHGSKGALKIHFPKQYCLQSKTFLMPILRPGYKLHKCILQTDDCEDYIGWWKLKNCSSYNINITPNKFVMSLYLPLLLVCLLNGCSFPFSFSTLTANEQCASDIKTAVSIATFIERKQFTSELNTNAENALF